MNASNEILPVDVVIVTPDVSSELQYFVEKDQCCLLLRNIFALSIEREDSFYQQYQLVDKILSKYLEQPLLLSAHTVDLVMPINIALSSLKDINAVRNGK